ncbi:MAG: SpoIIE family protein phosphatase [Candidatus Riflebacteria bacterium]|nr:SpoIIE family protein phosphatase [Candidatus Riflebacteria bacterium]
MINTNEKSIGAFLVYFFLLVFPILIPLGVLDRMIEQKIEDSIQKIEVKLEKDLELFIFETDPQEIFFKSFQQLFENLKNSDFNPEKSSGKSDIAATLPNSQTCAFTPTGQLFVPYGKTFSAKFVARNLWGDLLGLPEQTTQTPEQRLKMYRALFGTEFTLFEVQNDEGLFREIGPGKTDGAFIWKRFNNQGGLLSFISEFPSVFETMKNVIENTRRKTSIFIYDPSSNKFLQHGLSWFGWKRAMKKCVVQGGGAFIDNGNLCRVISHPQGLWLMEFEPVSKHLAPPERFIIRFIGLAIIASALFWWFKSDVSPFFSLKISPRILCIFLMSMFLPTVILLTLGFAFYKNKASILEEQVHEKNIEKLRMIDSVFPKHQAMVLNMFRDVRNQMINKVKNQSDFNEIFVSFRYKNYLVHATTFDQRGQVAFSNMGKAATGIKIGFYDIALNRYSNTKIPTSTNPLAMLSTNLYRSPRFGFCTTMDRPDSLNHINIGPKDFILYWDYSNPREISKTSLVEIIQFKDWDLDCFFSQNLASDVYAIGKKHKKWFPNEPPITGLKSLTTQALLGNHAIKQTFQLNGSTICASAFPSNSIPGYCYLTYSDLTEINSRVAGFRTLLICTAFIAIILSLLFSRMFSSSMINPLNELSLGIKAYEKKILSYKIPDLGSDEIGKLGIAFNQMMDVLHEVDLGQKFQKSLIPTIMPEFKGYEISLVNFSVSDLGGDYCDALLGPNGKLLIVTGDVTGHGIASSLLTVMAKTACYISSFENRDLQFLIERLNKLINRGVKKKRLMTLVAALVDNTTHILEWTCVGHPYPLLRKSDGTVKFLEMPQFPLGQKTKVQVKISKLEMSPGDMLIFYTDGLVESLNPDGETFDYSRLKLLLEKTQANSASGIIDEILHEFHKHTRGIPAADDVTLLAFLRKS